MTEIRGMEMMSQQGTLSWLQYNKIIFAWPISQPPKLWELKTLDSKTTFHASAYTSYRGTYVLQYHETQVASLILISSQTSVESITQKIYLYFNDPTRVSERKDFE